MSVNTNRETWKVSLWLEGDQGLYEWAREYEGGSDLENGFIGLLEVSPDLALTIVKDLLGPVDWDEILEALKAE